MSKQALEQIFFQSDFVGLSPAPPVGSVNLETLRAAIELAMPTSVPFAELVGTNTVRVVSKYAPPSEQSALLSTIAAHTGTVTSGALQQFQSLIDTTNATATYAPKQNAGPVDALWVSAPLSAGPYLLAVGAQIRMSVALSTTGVQVIVRSGFSNPLTVADDRLYTEDSFASSTIAQLYSPKPDVIIAPAGGVLRMLLLFKRIGPSGSAIMGNAKFDLCRIPVT